MLLLSLFNHLLYFVYSSDKSITSPGDILDVFIVARTLPEYLSKHENVLREIRLLYVTIWPQPLHHLFFFYNASLVLNQQDQGLEDLWCERDSFSVM